MTIDAHVQRIEATVKLQYDLPEESAERCKLKVEALFNHLTIYTIDTTLHSTRKNDITMVVREAASIDGKKPVLNITPKNVQLSDIVFHCESKADYDYSVLSLKVVVNRDQYLRESVVQVITPIYVFMIGFISENAASEIQGS